jgi:hypothetical protein
VKSSKEGQKVKAIAEVVASSITGLVAESWQKGGEDGLPSAARPGFGTFLRAASEEDETSVFAVVYNVLTAPLDSNHKPSALGLTREQLKLEQPQIFALLRTEIHAVTVGFAENARIFRHLPPRPPQVHDFVYPLTDGEIEAVTANLDFLSLVAGVTAVPADELLAATIREAYRARGADYTFLVEAGKTLARLFRDDYDRLVTVLKCIKPVQI